MDYNDVWPDAVRLSGISIFVENPSLYGCNGVYTRVEDLVDKTREFSEGCPIYVLPRHSVWIYWQYPGTRILKYHGRWTLTGMDNKAGLAHHYEKLGPDQVSPVGHWTGWGEVDAVPVGSS